MKHAGRLAMDGHGELAQFLRDAITDAARYRWLRTQPEKSSWTDADGCRVWRSPKALDASIDAAMVADHE
jgi:hypothetical protein